MHANMALIRLAHMLQFLCYVTYKKNAEKYNMNTSQYSYDRMALYKFNYYCTGIRGLMRGMATLPKVTRSY